MTRFACDSPCMILGDIFCDFCFDMSLASFMRAIRGAPKGEWPKRQSSVWLSMGGLCFFSVEPRVMQHAVLWLGTEAGSETLAPPKLVSPAFQTCVFEQPSDTLSKPHFFFSICEMGMSSNPSLVKFL